MELAVEKYKVASEPYYLPIKQEVELFEAAYAAKLHSGQAIGEHR